MKIHLTGAAGTGTTTLGRALAAHFGLPFFDSDSFYWLPTNPPFEQKRPMPERFEMMKAELDKFPEGWVIAGSMLEWGDALIPEFDLVVFMYVDAAERVKRLQAREAKRFGHLIHPGGPLYLKQQSFLEWASGYETGAHGGRSLPAHRAWLAALPCPVLRLEEMLSKEEALARTLAVLPPAEKPL